MSKYTRKSADKEIKFRAVPAGSLLEPQALSSRVIVQTRQLADDFWITFWAEVSSNHSGSRSTGNEPNHRPEVIFTSRPPAPEEEPAYTNVFYVDVFCPQCAAIEGPGPYVLFNTPGIGFPYGCYSASGGPFSFTVRFQRTSRTGIPDDLTTLDPFAF